MKKRSMLVTFMILFCLGATGECPPNDNMNNNNNNNSNNNNNDNNNNTNRITLNVVKTNTQSTTTRGPAVGDGVIAFNVDGNASLAWMNVGESPDLVSMPSAMAHSTTAFQFAGKKLVIRDRNSGSLVVFDTVTETINAMPSASINMGGSGGEDLWEADGNLVATANSTVTTADGAGKRIKVVNISNINSYVITPFDFNPPTAPSGITLDAATNRVVVRAGDTFYVYDITQPNDAPVEYTLNTLQGGTGNSDMQLEGVFLAFFNNNEFFTLLNVTNGNFTQPNRNPARANGGLAIEQTRFAYLAKQTADDGSNVTTLNRALVGATSDVNSLIDPAGIFVNGDDANDGRIGFGSDVAISPNGRWVFVSGSSFVDVGVFERLYLSEDGGDFKMIADPADPLNALRAAGAACSDNVVAFLVPIDLDAVVSGVRIAYAELPPP